MNPFEGKELLTLAILLIYVGCYILYVRYFWMYDKKKYFAWLFLEPDGRGR
jgi:hypothetical protein